MRVALFLIAAVSVAFLTINLVDLSRIAHWAIEAQRGFQNQMASAIRALKTGDVGAYAALLSATAAYGFVHALGPGHGKYLVGGVGQHALAHEGGLEKRSIEWADRSTSAHQIPCEDDCECAAHGPTLDQVARVGSLRDALGLVLSIAIRPCTGAIFLLVIAWQMELATAGAIAVVTMGLGTAGLTSLVAISSVAARNVAAVSIANHQRWGVVMPGIQVFSGAMIAFISLGLLGFSWTL